MTATEYVVESWSIQQAWRHNPHRCKSHLAYPQDTYFLELSHCRMCTHPLTYHRKRKVLRMCACVRVREKERLLCHTRILVIRQACEHVYWTPRLYETFMQTLTSGVSISACKCTPRVLERHYTLSATMCFALKWDIGRTLEKKRSKIGRLKVLKVIMKMWVIILACLVSSW